VREAADTNEGLQLLEVDAPDLIRLDEQLSTDDGGALLRAAPVITFSAEATALELVGGLQQARADHGERGE
jgi:DNA-binding response OmpR family regulator